MYSTACRFQPHKTKCPLCTKITNDNNQRKPWWRMSKHQQLINSWQLACQLHWLILQYSFKKYELSVKWLLKLLITFWVVCNSYFVINLGIKHVNIFLLHGILHRHFVNNTDRNMLIFSGFLLWEQIGNFSHFLHTPFPFFVIKFSNDCVHFYNLSF